MMEKEIKDLKSVCRSTKWSMPVIGLIIILQVFTVLFTGCAKSDKLSKITIAEQYGLAYAPLQIMKELKLMEKNLPDVGISWRQLNNTAAIREAMLTNEVDAGFMAIPPFLIGWDKGMEWKIATGLSSSPVGLVVNKPGIKSIKDFSKQDRIAVPQPGSVQHILLSMACEREFGDAHKLDDILVTLAHPDGMSALLAKKEITAHFTSPPYLIEELEQSGTHMILSGSEAMGKDFTFITGVTTNRFYNKNPKAYAAFVRSVKEAIDFIQINPESAVNLLSKIYGIDETKLAKELTWEGSKYDVAVKGVNDFAGFMKRNGYISKVPGGSDEIIWKDVKHE